jgi:hypothetical protein
VTIEDTAANIAAAFGTLFSDKVVRSIVVSNNAPVTLPPADLFEALCPGLYGRVLSITNQNGSPAHLQCGVSDTVGQLLSSEDKHVSVGSYVADTAANIAAALNTLNADPHVSSIFVQNGGALDISGSQYLSDGRAIGEIVSTTALDVSLPSGSHGQTFTATGLNTDWSLGGANAESFVFNAGFGQDLIAGYQPGHDTISFSHTLFANFAAMFSHSASDGRGDVVITYAPGESLTLTGVTLAQVQAHSSDFKFI